MFLLSRERKSGTLVYTARLDADVAVRCYRSATAWDSLFHPPKYSGMMALDRVAIKM